ncbi:hypothetical protein PROPHIGD54-2_73 [Mycobacterium phage prophiGD54-2]|uniref:HNH endonuclease n=1 Tax=Mycobacteroides abscessus TaxID=36809 RepID=UPI001AFA4DE8|nr:HNH endonuclease [Mycobacteroides abscessus]QSM04673.1 hypothetical protein PROPHIGD54-2_73 [Mycobacterium phage prophiGD54-2]
MTERQCRIEVLRRSGGLCERCGIGGGLSMHHRKKRSQGGPWSLDNIVHVCGHGTVGCHGWIEHNPNAAHSEGYHVRPWEEPASIPIYQHHLGKFTHMNLLGAEYHRDVDLRDPWSGN